MNDLLAAVLPEGSESSVGISSWQMKPGELRLLVLAIPVLLSVPLISLSADRHHYFLLLYLIAPMLTFGLYQRRLIYLIGVCSLVATMADCVLFPALKNSPERMITGYFSLLMQSMVGYLSLRKFRVFSNERKLLAKSDRQLKVLSSELAEKGRQQRRLERLNRHLLALNEIVARSGVSSEINDTCWLALEKMTELTGWDAAVLIQSDGHCLVCVNGTPPAVSRDEILARLTPAAQEMLLNYLHRDTRQFIIEYQLSDSEVSLLWKGTSLTRCVVLPLPDTTRSGGVLLLVGTRQRTLSDEDQSFLSAVAGHLAAAIDRARLTAESARQTAKQLALERNLTNLLTENAPVAIAHLTSSLTYAMTNPIYLDLLRTQCADRDLVLMGRDIDVGMPQIQINRAWKTELQRIAENGHPLRLPTQTSESAESGRVTYWDWTAWPVRDDQGKTESILLMGMEVTRWILAERGLEAALATAWTEHNKLEAVIRNITEAVFIAEAVSHRVVRVNAAAAQLLGYDSSHQLEKELDKYNALLNPRQADGTLLLPEAFPLARALRGEEVRDEHLVLRRLDGSFIHVMAGAAPVRNNSGEIVLAVCYLHDVTRLLNVQAELEKSNQSKDQFLAMLSHELRTPLTPIIGWIGIMAENLGNPATIRQGLESIERNASLQSQLVNDLLDLSRIMAGKIELRKTSVDMNQIIRFALETVQTRIDAQMLDLRLDLQNSPILVDGDPTRLEQIIWNVLNNAVRFTPAQGHIVIRSRSENGFCLIEVEDSGAGIAAEMLPQIFHLFQQGDSGTARKHGGLGVGLSISRSLVEMHGGCIRAESHGEGMGSKFTISIPLQTERQLPVAPLPPVVTARRSLAGIRVLVLEDSEDSREMFGIILRSRECEVRLAANAEDAWRIAEKFYPDVVISDIGLPGIDGYEFIRRLRTISGFEAVPVIALSGYAAEKDRLRATQAGFNLHLAKPIEPDLIIESIYSVLSRSNG
jgi:PAS domain S-box-containing protein